ncbi:hypothetical protein ACLB2K_020906 [Fragaria x ananassa]
MTEGSSNICVPKYAGHYDHWAELMENLLRSKDLWDVVEHGVTMETAEARMFSTVVTERSQLTEDQRKLLEDRRMKNLKAKNFLYEAISRDILETILDRSTDSQEHMGLNETKVPGFH